MLYLRKRHSITRIPFLVNKRVAQGDTKEAIRCRQFIRNNHRSFLRLSLTRTTSVDVGYFCTKRNLVNAPVRNTAFNKDDFLMSVIAPRDTTTRYKSLFSFGKRRLFFFYRLSRGSRSGLYYSPRWGCGMENDGVTHTRLHHFRTIRTAEFSARRIKASANDREMIQRKIRKESLSGSRRIKSR